MSTIGKVLVPNKEWLVKSLTSKIGSISKSKKGYDFLVKGQRINFKNLSEIFNKLGIEILEESNTNNQSTENKSHVIYDFPCSSKPFNPVYSLRKKLPIFAKSNKSKSQYCAGYYVIKFRKGWVKSFCPKLITLERYPYLGPYKTEQEMKNVLNTVNKS